MKNANLQDRVLMLCFVPQKRAHLECHFDRHVTGISSTLTSLKNRGYLRRCKRAYYITTAKGERHIGDKLEVFTGGNGGVIHDHSKEAMLDVPLAFFPL